MKTALTVQAGDTIDFLAARHGIPRERLLAENPGITASTRLTGQEQITVSASDPVTPTRQASIGGRRPLVQPAATPRPRPRPLIAPVTDPVRRPPLRNLQAPSTRMPTAQPSSTSTSRGLPVRSTRGGSGGGSRQGRASGRSVGAAETTAMEYFVGRGYTRAQAAGIVGNLIGESSLNPTIRGDQGRAYGIGQWHPDRQVGLRAYARSTGGNPASLETQLGYVDHELRTSERRAGDAIRASRDVYGATHAMTGFERPQGWRRGGRAEDVHGWQGRFGHANRLSGGSSAPARRMNLGGDLGGSAGAIAGQALIPIPGVGGVIGQAAGSMVGGLIQGGIQSDNKWARMAAGMALGGPAGAALSLAFGGGGPKGDPSAAIRAGQGTSYAEGGALPTNMKKKRRNLALGGYTDPPKRYSAEEIARRVQAARRADPNDRNRARLLQDASTDEMLRQRMLQQALANQRVPMPGTAVAAPAPRRLDGLTNNYNSLGQLRSYAEGGAIGGGNGEESVSRNFRRGDTVSAIAARYNIPVRDFLAYNPQITDANRINAGGMYLVPKAVDTRTEAAARRAERRQAAIEGNGVYTEESARRRGAEFDRRNPTGAAPAVAPRSRGRAPAAAAPQIGGQHRVQRGENLTELSRRFGVSIDSIMALNPQIRNANAINAGGVIRLPRGASFNPPARGRRRMALGGQMDPAMDPAMQPQMAPGQGLPPGPPGMPPPEALAAGAVPMGGNAAEFQGPSHANGGIPIPGTDAEVEGGETVDKVNGSAYVFSKSMKVPGTQVSFADMHKKLVDSGAPEQEIKQLAALQERTRGHAPGKELARGGSPQPVRPAFVDRLLAQPGALMLDPLDRDYFAGGPEPMTGIVRGAAAGVGTAARTVGRGASAAAGVVADGAKTLYENRDNIAPYAGDIANIARGALGGVTDRIFGRNGKPTVASDTASRAMRNRVVNTDREAGQINASARGLIMDPNATGAAKNAAHAQTLTALATLGAGARAEEDKANMTGLQGMQGVASQNAQYREAYQAKMDAKSSERSGLMSEGLAGLGRTRQAILRDRRQEDMGNRAFAMQTVLGLGQLAMEDRGAAAAAARQWIPEEMRAAYDAAIAAGRWRQAANMVQAQGTPVANQGQGPLLSAANPAPGGLPSYLTPGINPAATQIPTFGF